MTGLVLLAIDNNEQDRCGVYPHGSSGFRGESCSFYTSLIPPIEVDKSSGHFSQHLKSLSGLLSERKKILCFYDNTFFSPRKRLLLLKHIF